MHVWITRGEEGVDTTPLAMTRNTDLHNVCEFKRGIAGLFTEQFSRMLPEHFRRLAQLFIEHDRDKDGMIRFDEFCLALSNMSSELSFELT